MIKYKVKKGEENGIWFYIPWQGSWFFGLGALLGVVLGIVGLVLADQAKRAGNIEGIRTAGFVCSLIGLIGSGIAVIIALGAVFALGTLAYMFA